MLTDLTLYVHKWICGAHQKYAHGLGNTELCNEDGFMCCLGQFAEQAGFPLYALKYKALLTDINLDFKNAIAFTPFLVKSEDQYIATALADQLLNINDHAYVPIHERITLIKKALNQHGITLHVVDKNDILTKNGPRRYL